MSMRPSTPTRLLLPALACAMGAGPFATQILGPALPAMTADFDAPVWIGQLVLSGGLAAIAVATLFYGLAADRIGRRPAMLWGQAAFLLGSVGAAVAPDLASLIAARVVQSAGGAAGLALARPILIDVYGPEGAAKRFTALLAAMVVAPMIAPIVGGFVGDAAGWRATFGVSAVVAIALTIALTLAAPETRPPQPRGAARGSLFADAAALARHPAFCGYAAVGALALGVFFAFVAAAPAIAQGAYGLSSAAYGAWFAGFAVGFMAGGLLANRIVDRLGRARLVTVGMALSLIGAVVGGALVFAGVWTPSALFGPGYAIAVGNGLAMGQSQTAAAAVDPDRAGAAAGISGAAQMAFGALCAQGVGSVAAGSPYPLALAALAICAFGFAAALWTERRLSSDRRSAPIV